MAQRARTSQLLALIVGDTPPFELDIAASAIEFLYETGTITPELELAASAIEYLYVPGAAPSSALPNDPIAVGYVPGPRWQMAARQRGQD